MCVKEGACQGWDRDVFEEAVMVLELRRVRAQL